MLWSSLLVLAASVAAAPSWSATPLNPPSVPLAVRSPYLSTWLAQGGGTALNGAWPTFWNGDITGWAGIAKVDGTPYVWMGQPSGVGNGVQQATQTGFSYTSTQSTFVMTAGPVQLTINFLSPVEPTDLVKQSIPMSYLSVTAQSTDGNTHSVQIYSDISAEWASGDDSLTVNWTTTTGNVLQHQVQLVDQQQFGEHNDHSQYGSAIYAIQGSDSTTYQTGQDTVVRSTFASSGKLPNTEDMNFRAVSDNWPVFAFAQDLGNVGSGSSAPVTFVVGRVRDPAINYLVANGQMQARSLYYLSEYATNLIATTAFLSDYQNALSRANTLDQKISDDATSKVSGDYAAIVALSVRQALGAVELTLSTGSDGTLNTSDVLVFMKEISSDGNVNTVDVMFPAWPIYLYLNPSLGRYLIEPLFRYQATGQYPNKWSVHDMGASYPVANGHNDGKDEAMPVEESGNMLIMTMSYTRVSGDRFLINTYKDLLDQWTQFLISDSLIPANQLSTDDFAGTLANQTNLAIKGTVGIKAMSLIEGLLGNTDTANNYSSIASSYAPQIVQFADSGAGHLELNYGNTPSWGLTYNLVGERLIGSNTFADSVYSSQTAWYKTVINQYGIPLDTRHTYTKSDWQIWTASIVTDTSVRDQIVSGVRNYLSSGANSQPFGDWYDTISAADQGFRARPVVGGHFALLIPTPDSAPPRDSPKNTSSNSVRGQLTTVPLAGALAAWFCVWLSHAV